MVIEEKGGTMPLARSAKSVVKILSFAAGSAIAMVLAFTGTIIGMQGGNIWPWAIASFVVYLFEIIFVSIMATRHYRSPLQRALRERALRRKEARDEQLTKKNLRD